MALQLDQIKQTSSFPQAPEGTHPARIVQVVDFGLQPRTHWQTGEPTAPKSRVYVGFELPSSTFEVENKETGEKKEYTHVVGKEYTLSTHEKSDLMKLIRTVKPDTKSLIEFLNLPVLVEVGRTKGDKAKIENVMKPPQGMPVPEATVETSYFDKGNPAKEAWDSLKDWQKKNILESLDYKGECDEWVEPKEDEAKAEY